MQIPEIILKKDREKSLLRGHPWIFSGAIASSHENLTTGCTVRILSSNGDFLATGAFSPESNIRARVWDWNEQTVIDKKFFHDRIRQAVESRSTYLDHGNTACRLIFAESDGLPGLIADQYNNQLVVQFLSAGPEYWKDTIVNCLAEITGIGNIYERSDVEVRKLEGLPESTGTLKGDPPDSELEIYEDGLRYIVDVKHGHKTGFYLDQRVNRRKVRNLGASKTVLNCFSYTGGFSIAALAGGAENVLSIDSSLQAVEQGKSNANLNKFDRQMHEWVVGDVFVELRGLRDRRRTFDLIILDPPKFAATRKQASQAARGYKDINLLAFKLLNPGGTLVTFSCSGGIDPIFFQKIVAGAALDAGAEAQIIDRLTQSPDHPTALHFPEAQYLKGLVIRKTR